MTDTTGTDSRTLEQVQHAIRSGELDDHLRQIEHEIKSRRAKVAMEIANGTRVRLSDQVSPQYLRGLTGTIVDRKVKRGGKITFRMEVDEHLRTDRISRFLDPFTNTIGGAADLFEVIED